MIKNFTEIIVWKKAHELTLHIYKITESFPKHEIFGIVSQMRRSSSSIPSNIVEGFNRKGVKDSLHFYNIAESSLEELKYQLLLSRDLTYISEKEYLLALQIAEEVGKLLNGWIKSQKS